MHANYREAEEKKISYNRKAIYWQVFAFLNTKVEEKKSF